MMSAGSALPETGGPAAAGTLAFASYNIHSGVGLDRRRSAARIAGVLKELDCDLFALQEVDNQPGDHEESLQLERFARELNMEAVPGLRIVRHTGEYGNALLTRLPVLSVRRHDLSHSWFEPRGALDVQVEAAGQPVRVIATHFGLRRAERLVQWRALMSHLTEASPQLPTVLLGDINEWFRSSAMLREARRIFGEPPTPAEFPSFAPCFALSRIWVSPHAALLSVTAHRTALSRRASDHLPIRGVIDVAKLLGAEEEKR